MSTIKQKHQELIEQAEALLAKAKEIEHLIEGDENTTTPSKELFGIVAKVVKDDNEYHQGWYAVYQDTYGKWTPERCYGKACSPIFTTWEAAENWANVFAVMMELRCQEGVINPVDNDDGVFIFSLDHENNTLGTDLVYPSFLEGALAPCFNSMECALKAIDNVGEERIIKAIKTISGVK